MVYVQTSPVCLIETVSAPLLMTQRRLPGARSGGICRDGEVEGGTAPLVTGSVIQEGCPVIDQAQGKC